MSEQSFCLGPYQLALFFLRGLKAPATWRSSNDPDLLAVVVDPTVALLLAAADDSKGDAVAARRQGIPALAKRIIRHLVEAQSLPNDASARWL